MGCSQKVGIVSPYGLYNCGNRLQAYAVWHLLNKRGLDAEQVLTPSLDQHRGPKAYAKEIVYSVAPRSSKAKRFRAFKEFDNLMPKRRFRNEEDVSQVGYDYAVIGSDQIWNPNHIYPSSTVFGGFVDPGRRICLSPSFGVSELPSGIEGVYRDGVSKIKWLSVREDAGAEIIGKLTGRQSAVLLDPTFALTRDDWGVVASDEKVPTKPFVFSYFLGSEGAQSEKFASDFAKKIGCEHVNMMDSSGIWYETGPQDFIGMIRHAAFVCTNSYHATVFSLIYNKPFRVFGRVDGPSMSSRIDSLVRRFNIGDRVADGEISLEEREIKSRADDVIIEQRVKINSYLDSALSLSETN